MRRAYLVDTNVVSVRAPGRGDADDALADWMDAASDRLFVSSISIAEIADGVAKLGREGRARRAAALAGWLDAVLHLYADRILRFDAKAALAAGPLLDLARGRGHAPGFADAAIAATARVHGLTILTRNLRHFSCFDADALDPFAALPT